ncbi:Aldo-keto reductase family 1 member C4 [Frankliniella fusca]|uniref:Aldo-keto reductase family 1 member C4 n=1 Tax=Frankliniella fusca TaxID=407009 RepID=A0AAE1H8Q6_9NEOP|nr:Aldo-keto reductase family 1 member C4 [Frankliniella fusca]
MSESPYKKLNKDWVGYVNITILEPNKAYKMLNIQETNHKDFGPGQQATIEAHDGRKWRTQLPGKYLAQLTKEDIQSMKQDILNEKNVFLVFREVMIDKSYRIDIIENDMWCTNFQKHMDVPELEASIEEAEEKGNGEESLKYGTEGKVEDVDSEKPGKDNSGTATP